MLFLKIKSLFHQKVFMNQANPDNKFTPGCPLTSLTYIRTPDGRDDNLSTIVLCADVQYIRKKKTSNDTFTAHFG